MDFDAFFDVKNDTSNIWALLVAGSNSWYNYRHQADVSNAYHVIRDHGVSEDHIVTMMFNDIANHPNNPFPGKIFNSPDKEDVYEGVKIDYEGNDVNPSNFFAILKGQKDKIVGGNGKVIESTKKDKIFIFFSDHGATGLISMPQGIITAEEISEAHNYLHQNGLYSSLVWYLEACESGSMFESLKSDMNIYALTAANSHESSWGCYCDNKLKLPCLGDTFSVSWIMDSKKENLEVETLDDQYEIVKKLTNQSHVCKFGNFSIGHEHVAEFQGHKKSFKNSKPINFHRFKHELNKGSMPSRDIPLLLLQKELLEAQNHADSVDLSRQISKIESKRQYMDRYIHKIVKRLIHDPNNRQAVLENHPLNGIKQLKCHDVVSKFYHHNCFNLNRNPYAMKYVYVLANICDMNIPSEIIINGLSEVCGTVRITNIL
uniref:Legumain n=1 Tax=Rhabditophanes sp. KR3021 TaxID=114890 RepID=A0AC35TK81_9BILA